MQCPRCEYQMEPWDTQCPRCVQAGQQAPAPGQMPYPPPAYPTSPPGVHTGQGHPTWYYTLNQFVATAGLTKGIAAFLIAQFVVNLLSGFAWLHHATLIANQGGGITQEVRESAGLIGLLAIAGGLTSLPLFVIWLVWVNRAYRNVFAFGAMGLKFTPGWAVGYYFIPIMNLFRPYQAMVETWQGSDPNVPSQSGLEWQNAPVPGLLLAWWLTFILPGPIFGIIGMAGRDPHDPAAPTALSSQMSALADFGMVSAAVLAIMVVQKVSALQMEKYSRLYNAYYLQAP